MSAVPPAQPTRNMAIDGNLVDIFSHSELIEGFCNGKPRFFFSRSKHVETNYLLYPLIVWHGLGKCLILIGIRYTVSSTHG